MFYPAQGFSPPVTKDDRIVFGIFHSGGHARFSMRRDVLRDFGRALLAAIGDSAAVPDDLLDTFRAARVDCTLLGLSPQQAAEKRNIDAEIFAEWLVRVSGPAVPNSISP